MSMRLPAGGMGGVSLDRSPLPLGVRLRRRAGVGLGAGATGEAAKASHLLPRLPNRDAEARGDRMPLLSSGVRDASAVFDRLGVNRRLTGPGVPVWVPDIAPIDPPAVAL